MKSSRLSAIHVIERSFLGDRSRCLRVLPQGPLPTFCGNFSSLDFYNFGNVFRFIVCRIKFCIYLSQPELLTRRFDLASAEVQWCDPPWVWVREGSVSILVEIIAGSNNLGIGARCSLVGIEGACFVQASTHCAREKYIQPPIWPYC